MIPEWLAILIFLHGCVLGFWFGWMMRMFKAHREQRKMYQWFLGLIRGVDDE